jgi:hypothetical protein
MLFVFLMMVVVLLAFGRSGMFLGGLHGGREHRRAGKRRQSQDKNEFFHG